MSSRRRALGLAALCAAALAGCGTLSNEAPRFEFFVIEDLRPIAEPPTAPPRTARSLLLTTGATQALYDSDRIVFTRDGAGRAYYQYSNWSERPARRVLALAEARLARGGGFRSVAQTLAGVRGDVVLTLRLDELIHDG
ncbi:MAG: membrane integrity-associated transporter subunit PqiC, partial [Burkholderiales bacterium]|nr:membrane integrity-associated transporter subunit PqiC [Burkholderiales bacterium]